MTRKMTQRAGVSLALLIGPAAAVAGANVYVWERGSFDPNGTINAPYDTIHAGIAEARANGSNRLLVWSGTYSETMTIDEPMTITNPSNQPAIIGDLGSDSTTFEVATFNTHLYGSAVPETIVDTMVFLQILSDPLHWLDNYRASRIALNYSGSTADVVALQEVWDPNYMSGIPLSAGYPRRFRGSAIDYQTIPGCVPVPPFGCISFELNSGLVTMTRGLFGDVRQVFFNHETDDDDFFEPFASKGYLRTEIIKDGFKVAVYNLHAQAGPESNSSVWSTRFQQFYQLQLDVINYRNQNPSVPIILTGDFNVRGSGNPNAEYNASLRFFFDTASMTFIDAARSDRANRPYNGVTSNPLNRLGQYFGGGDDPAMRLDYVLYMHSKDLSVRLTHIETETIQQRGPAQSHDGLNTTELSDHWAVHSKFRVVRH